ncbi:hypothetical protein PAXRUDRAFT_591560 [Paxillus rubicundulus Ve08.2h10]|uniref:VanZ-like domain-containing protein n=1 Tax=Paxillus rubicundulus Ve08.2h10 TaxID=930991 RepID=A0A0D0DZ45_9AGAM|nr:hypothetical protein PAXRUDRAFT_591560 [Paxillus rubicundulus Ve08.2h10]
MILLASLGFTNFSHSLPLNDKFLHFTCFCVATGLFYFVFDVEEDARRVWFWRHAGLIFAVIHKEFDFGDVAANILGSTIGLYTSYHIEKYYRSRREIARLYRPLDTDESSDAEYYSDDEGGPSGTQLLPLFNSQPTDSSAKSPSLFKSKIHKADRLGDVWDEREELFGIGDDSDSEETVTPTPLHRGHGSPQPGPYVPKITITQS